MSPTKKAPKPKRTEAEMVGMLRRRYCTDSGNGPSAVLIPQVRNAAGFDANRTADALVMQLWPSRGLHLEGFEIKCSRSDLLSELKAPEKAEAIARWCERWWLVLGDESHIKDGELPEPWGLLVARGDRLFEVKPAPVRPVPKELPKSFLAALMRRYDGELARPTIEALKAAGDAGYERGKRDAGYASRELERLKEAVKAFEDATGIKVTGHLAPSLSESKAIVRLITGGNSWNGIVARLDRFATEAAALRAELADAGFGGTDG